MTLPAPVVLHEPEIRQLVGFDRVSLAAVRKAFVPIADDSAVLPPVMHLHIPEFDGDIDIKSAWLKGMEYVAVKVGAGYPGNRQRGLPSSPAMMSVFSAMTGMCSAVLLDNGYLTDLRTGLAGAVAANVLAPPGAVSVGIIGAGVQARYQLQALTLVRKIERVEIWARRLDEAEKVVLEARQWLDAPITVNPSLESTVRNNTVIVSTTPSTEPIIRASWIKAGQHINAVGSDLPGKRELEAALVLKADQFVCDRIAQSERLGELQNVLQRKLAGGRALELWEILESSTFVRPERAMTICDLTGLGSQDTAIATACLRAVQSGSSAS